MPQTLIEPREVGLAIATLRWLKGGWSQAELARQSGVDKGLISDYELGIRVPTRRNLERLAAAAGVGYSFIENLLPRCRGICLAYEEATREPATEAPAGADLAPGLEEKVAGSFRTTLAPFLQELSHLLGEPAPRPEDRSWAAERWRQER